MRYSVLAVSHDAGGAELLSSYLKRGKAGHKNILCVAHGPAKDIFTRKGLGGILIDDETGKRLIADKAVDLLLASTSVWSDIERIFIKLARNNSVKTAAFLDHWIKYRERFGYPARGWQENLPDDIWVTDRLARLTAEKELKRVNAVRIKPNYYFADLRIEYKKIAVKKDKRCINVLFLGDVFKDDCAGGVKGAERLLKAARAVNTGKNKIISFTLRPHPVEAPVRYMDMVKKYNGPKLRTTLSIPRRVFLLEDIKKADLIIGAYSISLVIAGLFGKKVLCCAAQFPVWLKGRGVRYIGGDIRKNFELYFKESLSGKK